MGTIDPTAFAENAEQPGTLTYTKGTVPNRPVAVNMSLLRKVYNVYRDPGIRNIPSVIEASGVRIRYLDHYILGKNSAFYMRESGLWRVWRTYYRLSRAMTYLYYPFYWARYTFACWRDRRKSYDVKDFTPRIDD